MKKYRPRKPIVMDICYPKDDSVVDIPNAPKKV
jgi:hypothetical protein